MTDIIYRIQDKDGRGPYKPGWSHYWQEERCLIDGSKFPTFMEEFPNCMNEIKIRFYVDGGHFGCGFRNLEQLNNWFTKQEQEKLKNYNYQIVRIKADKILAESERQLVFWCKRPLRSIAKPIEHNRTKGLVTDE